MKKWVSIVFSLYLLMASSPFFAVAKQDVSARETAKVATEQGVKQTAKKTTEQGVKLGTKGVKTVNSYIGKPKLELLKSKSSYKKLIKEHQAKLDAFKKDPIGNTNPANLKQMMKDNPTQEVLLERAKGRIGALEKQLTKQQGELKQINEALKKLE